MAQYEILSNPAPEVIAIDKVFLGVRLIADDARVTEFTTTISTPNGATISEAEVYSQLNAQAIAFNSASSTSLPVISLTLGSPFTAS